MIKFFLISIYLIIFSLQIALNFAHQKFLVPLSMHGNIEYKIEKILFDLIFVMFQEVSYCLNKFLPLLAIPSHHDKMYP